MIYKAMTIIGFIVDVGTIAFWLGLSPEEAISTAYPALPFITTIAGVVAGWGLHGLLVDSEAKKAAAVEKEKQDGESERMRMEEERREQERIQRKQDDHLRDISSTFNHLTTIEREVLHAMIGRGAVYFLRSYLKNIESKHDYGDVLILGDQHMEGEMVRLTPSEKAKEVYEHGIREFELISEDDYRIHSVYDPREERIPDRAYDRIPLKWWFYCHTHEEDWEIIQEQKRQEYERIHGPKQIGRAGGPPGHIS